MDPIAEFDAGAISARLELERDAFTEGIRLARQQGADFAREAYKASLGVDSARGEADLSAFAARLEEIDRSRVNVRVDADTAAADAKLAAVDAEADAVGGKNPTVRVDADTSSARTAVAGLFTWITALGPALIPVGAAGVGALGGIAAAAGAGAAGLGATALGFSGISAAVKAMDKAQESSGAGAVRSAGRQASAAATIASAERSLANTRAQAADAAISAQEAVTRAEESEQRAVVDLARAQQNLTDARKQAAQTLEDLKLKSEDAALAERRAKLDVERARRALNYANTYAFSTALQRREAKLAFDEAVQHEKEQRIGNARLASEKKAADKAGVEGSKQVRQALQGEHDATQRLADARRSVADAQRAQRAQQRQSAFQVAQAEAAVANAARSQAGATSSASSATDKLNEALEKLSPQAREFATFVHGTLIPDFDALRKSAQAGLLPGVESGIKAVLPLLPPFSRFTGSVAGEMGHLADQAGRALNTPFWQRFFGYVDRTAVPTLDQMGTVTGNLASGFAGLTMAFDPVQRQMGAGLVRLTDRFANFGKTAGSNSEFQRFLAYVETNGPLVVHTIGDLAGATGRVLAAAAPLGPPLLQIVDLLAKLVSWQPELAALGLEFWAWSRAFGSMGRMLPTAAGGLGLFTTRTKEAKDGSKAAVTGGLTPLGLAVTAVGAATFYGYSKWQQYNSEVKNAASGARETQHTFLGFYGTLAAEEDKMNKRANVRSNWNPISRIAAQLGPRSEAQDNVTRFTHNIDALTSSFNISRDAAVLFAGAAGADLVSATGDVNGAVVKWIASQEKANLVSGRWGSTIVAIDAQVNTAKDGITAYDYALQALTSTTNTAYTSNVNYKQTLSDLDKQFRQNGISLSDNTDKGRSNITMVNNAIDAAKRHAAAVYKDTYQNSKLTDETARRRQAEDAANRVLETDINNLVAHAQRAGISKTAIDRLLTSLGVYGKTRSNARVGLSGYTTSSRDLAALLRQLHAIDSHAWTARIIADATSKTSPADIGKPAGNLSQLLTRGIPGQSRRAAGGVADAYASYLVGERGPEILTMGAHAGYVTPNSQVGVWAARGGDGADLAGLLQQLVAQTRRQNTLLETIATRHPAAISAGIGRVLNGAASDAEHWDRNAPY